MDKPQILGLGLNGLVGSRISEQLFDKYDFVGLSRLTGVDITDIESLTNLKKYPDAKFVLLFSAKADVDACEQDKALGEEGEAWKINVLGTKNVAEICRELGKKIIYISTDFVFDGQKEKGDSYTEEDIPNPINWYSKTKFEGEKRVEESDAPFIILRLAFPYRAEFEPKKDFVRAIIDTLRNGTQIKGVTDQIFCPTLIDDIALALDALIKNDATGIYHAVGSEAITPFAASIKIAENFGLDKNLITETTREEFFKDRAPRPFNLQLRNAKIEQLGVKMKGFSEGLIEIKSQLNPL